MLFYVSDIEMRMGFLGRLSDLPLNGHMMQPQGLADMVRSNSQIGILFAIMYLIYLYWYLLLNIFFIPIMIFQLFHGYIR